MNYFMGIVPPDEIRQRIEVFRASWGPATTEPHITVKAPNSLGNPQQWLTHVTALCARVPPLDVCLQGVSQFGTSVLYLGVLSDEIIGLHNTLVSAVNPPISEQKAFFEGEAYRPHLTLLHAESEVQERALTTMRALAAEAWAHPTFFLATSLRVYQSTGNGQGYIKYLDLPLLGKGACAETSTG